MTFKNFIKHFKKYSNEKMSFSKEFINEFIESGFELFLFHNAKEEIENQNATDAILKSNQQQYIHTNLQDLRTKILHYNSLYPQVIYFTYEPRKTFYIARACLKTQVVCATSTKSLQMQGTQSSKSCVKAYHNV